MSLIHNVCVWTLCLMVCASAMTLVKIQDSEDKGSPDTTKTYDEIIKRSKRGSEYIGAPDKAKTDDGTTIKRSKRDSEYIGSKDVTKTDDGTTIKRSKRDTQQKTILTQSDTKDTSRTKRDTEKKTLTQSDTKDTSRTKRDIQKKTLTQSDIKDTSRTKRDTEKKTLTQSGIKETSRTKRNSITGPEMMPPVEEGQIVKKTKREVRTSFLTDEELKKLDAEVERRYEEYKQTDVRMTKEEIRKVVMKEMGLA